MTGAQQLTPTGREIAERHRAFHAKIAARAVPDTGIGTRQKFGEKVVVPTPVAVFEPEPEIIAWRLRQEKLHQPLKKMWFSIVGETKPPQPPISEIQAVTAKQFGISRALLLGSIRVRAIVVPRQIAMYLAHQLTDQSMPAIGRQFGGRDHTTALHAIRKIKRQSEEDSGLAAQITAIRDVLMEGRA